MRYITKESRPGQRYKCRKHRKKNCLESDLFLKINEVNKQLFEIQGIAKLTSFIDKYIEHNCSIQIDMNLAEALKRQCYGNKAQLTFDSSRPASISNSRPHTSLVTPRVVNRLSLNARLQKSDEKPAETRPTADKKPAQNVQPLDQIDAVKSKAQSPDPKPSNAPPVKTPEKTPEKTPAQSPVQTPAQSPAKVPANGAAVGAVTKGAREPTPPTPHGGKHENEQWHGSEMAVSVDTEQEKQLFNIVFVTSEVAPWSKTGGLADVCESLPKALTSRGHRVMVVSPRYEEYEEAIDTETIVQMGDNQVKYFHYVADGVDYVFVDHPSFLRPGGLYGDMYGVYGDNQFRYQLLCVAALEAPLQLKLEGGLYGQDCMFVCNDWHGALVPVYLAANYRKNGVYLGARSVLAIHNLKHQGVFPPGTFDLLNLPYDWIGALEWQYPPHERQGSWEEEGKAVNTLKAGIITADRLVTVSPSYAWEVQTSEGGCGMEFLLSARSYAFNGILNGIDSEVWDPATDEHLPVNYDITSYQEGKAKNKALIQEELGLPVKADVPLIAFIGRLDFQKGADLIIDGLSQLMEMDVQLVCLGTGDQGLEDGFKWMERSYPQNARGWVGFNVPFSHRLTAAADLLLMPSRFEPCGLNQLYAMKYGTVPVAHATGGLKDTVIPFDPFAEKNEATGWTFSPHDVDSMLGAVANALLTYRQHNKEFRLLQENGMKRDTSWDLAAQQYEQIFDWSKTDLPYAG